MGKVVDWSSLRAQTGSGRRRRHTGAPAPFPCHRRATRRSEPEGLSSLIALLTDRGGMAASLASVYPGPCPIIAPEFAPVMRTPRRYGPAVLAALALIC